MSGSGIEETESGFSITGEMSFATVNSLLAASSGFNFTGRPVLDIDLGGITRADSAGLALLVEWTAKARLGATDIRFRNMPAQMREIARMTEVDKLLSL